MAKQKKKRIKSYSGSDAKSALPKVTRISAANRNKLSQWWFDNKRVAKPLAIGMAVGVVVVWLLAEFVGLLMRNA